MRIARVGAGSAFNPPEKVVVGKRFQALNLRGCAESCGIEIRGLQVLSTHRHQENPKFWTRSQESEEKQNGRIAHRLAALHSQEPVRELGGSDLPFSLPGNHRLVLREIDNRRWFQAARPRIQEKVGNVVECCGNIFRITEKLLI